MKLVGFIYIDFGLTYDDFDWFLNMRTYGVHLVRVHMTRICCASGVLVCIWCAYGAYMVRAMVHVARV